MNIQEFYAAIGVDYREPLRRFAGSEKMLTKFLVKAAGDPTYDNLARFLAQPDYPEAFRAAHTLKGICLNLDLKPLLEASSELTELLREKSAPDLSRVEPAMEAVTAAYNQVISLLSDL